MPEEAVQHGRLAGALHEQIRLEHERRIARGVLVAAADTYDISQGDGVEEGGGAPRRGVVGGVGGGEEHGRLARSGGVTSTLASTAQI